MKNANRPRSCSTHCTGTALVWTHHLTIVCLTRAQTVSAIDACILTSVGERRASESPTLMDSGGSETSSVFNDTAVIAAAHAYVNVGVQIVERCACVRPRAPAYLYAVHIVRPVLSIVDCTRTS